MRIYERTPLCERFWDKVLIGDGCWEWTACRNRAGYGGVSVGRSQKEQAHRVSWELTNGPIPEGMFVCHHCDNPGCVRPGHLFLGAPVDNSVDMVSKGRAPAARLSPADVARIRERVATGEVQRAVGEDYGIRQAHVSRIALRKTWRNMA